MLPISSPLTCSRKDPGKKQLLSSRHPLCYHKDPVRLTRDTINKQTNEQKNKESGPGSETGKTNMRLGVGGRVKMEVEGSHVIALGEDR